MKRILLTAFEPYDNWPTNSSQLVLECLGPYGAPGVEVTRRVYPVNFSTIQQLLADDLAGDYDYAIHLGQAPGSHEVALESLGINVAIERQRGAPWGVPLISDGAAAYQSRLPLGPWAEGLQGAGIPARVSYHAGTYLCNAALYLSCHLAEVWGRKTKSGFLHLPLATEQVASAQMTYPTLPLDSMVRAVRWILEQLPGEPERSTLDGHTELPRLGDADE
jgi:pyroglutamyl-peptidase